MKLPSSYPEFLQKIKQYEVGELSEFIKHGSKPSHVFNQQLFVNNVLPATYILDYTQQKYLYATGKVSNITERPLSYFLDGGVDFALSVMHKADLKVYSEKVMVSNLRFLKDQPVHRHTSFLFSCNYRIKNKQGSYKNVVQQSIFLKSAESKMPLVAYGCLYDITQYRNDSKIFHTIQPLDTTAAMGNLAEPAYSNIYFATEEDSLLTRRETEILKWVCEELDSDEIAQKLNISKFTVDNHRRNLLMKTNTKNSLGLFKYAIKHRLI